MYAYCIGRPLEMWLSVGTSFSIISERQKTRKNRNNKKKEYRLYRNNNGLYGCENGGQFLPRAFYEYVVDGEQTRYQCKQLHCLEGNRGAKEIKDKSNKCRDLNYHTTPARAWYSINYKHEYVGPCIVWNQTSFLPFKLTILLRKSMSMLHRLTSIVQLSHNAWIVSFLWWKSALS